MGKTEFGCYVQRAMLIKLDVKFVKIYTILEMVLEGLKRRENSSKKQKRFFILGNIWKFFFASEEQKWTSVI